MNRILIAFTSLVLLASAEAAAATPNYCGELRNAFGPFDYRRRAEFAESFYLVEMAHFTSDVENGIKGSTGLLGGDLDYTLRAIPNHHRALSTLANVARRDRTLKIPGMNYAAECYFLRALRFTPDDGTVHTAYGSYLFSMGKLDQSLQMLKQGFAYEPDNPGLNYNLGLIYVKQKNYDKARFHAQKAYASGIPLPGLKKQLIEAKQWEPQATN